MTPPVTRIRGTEGKLDYVVVARKDGIVAGLKLLIDRQHVAKANETVHTVAFRLRSTQDPENIREGITPSDFVSAWPKANFEYQATTHARTLIGRVVREADPLKLVAALDKAEFFPLLFAYLLDSFGEEYIVVTETQLREAFLSEIERYVAPFKPVSEDDWKAATSGFGSLSESLKVLQQGCFAEPDDAADDFDDDGASNDDDLSDEELDEPGDDIV